MATEAKMEKLTKDLNDLSEDAKGVLEATAEDVGGKMSEMRNRMSSAFDSAKGTYYRVQQKAVDGAKVADKKVHEFPYQSMGIAFGVGLLIGILASRR